MKHYEYEMSLFVDGELPEAEREELFVHLSKCQECRDTLSEYMELKEKSREFYTDKIGVLKNGSAGKNRFYKYIVYTGIAAAIIIMLLINIDTKPRYITKTEVKYDTVFVAQKIQTQENNTKVKAVFTSHKKNALKAKKKSEPYYDLLNMASVKITDADTIKSYGSLL